MPEDVATMQAEDGKLVTITIAEKSGGETATDSSLAAVQANTFIIDNGKKILTITIAE